MIVCLYMCFCCYCSIYSTEVTVEFTERVVSNVIVVIKVRLLA